jgi:predicted nucleic acid-binding protein
LDYVLDSGAIIAYFDGEPGGDMVANLLADPSHVCYCHAVNLAEVHYHFWRTADEAAADKVMETLRIDGLITREDMDESFWKAISRLKVNGNISIADCFCIALAQRLSAEVVTTDHREFDPLVPLGLCPITFIR